METQWISNTLQFQNTGFCPENFDHPFWNEEGSLHIGYLPHNTTIEGACYANLLWQAIKNGLSISSKMLFLQDNAPAHTAQNNQSAVQQCRFELDGDILRL